MIKATLYMELPQVGMVADVNAMAVIRRGFEIEAEKHGYELIGEPQVTGGGDEPWLLVWEVKDRS